MRIADCELWRFSTPFKREFSHARATRRESDAIIVVVRSEQGAVGFGEIQARTYVTGESNDEIWDIHAPALAARMPGTDIHAFADIGRVLGGEAAYAGMPAAVGGFDLALSDCLELEHGLDWPTVFGPERNRPAGKCLTIGDDSTDVELRRQGRYARLTGCSVVKLKVAGAADAERVATLREAVGTGVAIRLDANGELLPDDAAELLARCRDFAIESIEEPLDRQLGDLEDRLASLHEISGVPIVADESMCTLADIGRFADRRAYQVVNVRVGKCGGVTGTARFLRLALEKGFNVVSGTMVGETAVMLRISRKMLHYCGALDYVEGLDQARVLTVAQVVEAVGDDPRRHFAWVPLERDRYRVGHKTAN